jgi:tetratricopeptide (TPR) repeat protein
MRKAFGGNLDDMASEWGSTMLSATGKARTKFHVLVLIGGSIGLASGALAQTTRYTCLNDSGDKAITACNAVLKANSNDSEAYLSRGSEYAHKGDHERAIADYNSALQLNPVYALAYYNRGLARESRDELGLALSDFQKAAQLSPADPDVKRAVARLSATDSEGPKSVFGNFFSRSSNNDAPTGATRPSARPNNTSRLEALERLAKLRGSGVLTKQEFEREKARILKE